MDFLSDEFAQRVEKVIDQLKKEDNFFLGHIETDFGAKQTIFGVGCLGVIVPGHVGEEVEADLAQRIKATVFERYVNEDEQRKMLPVMLPKKKDIGKLGSKNHPTLWRLTPTRMLEKEGDVTAVPSFYVQAKYLKAALSVATFSGWRNPSRQYAPMYMYASDDRGEEATAILMPYLPKSEEEANGQTVGSN